MNVFRVFKWNNLQWLMDIGEHSWEKWLWKMKNVYQHPFRPNLCFMNGILPHLIPICLGIMIFRVISSFLLIFRYINRHYKSSAYIPHNLYFCIILDSIYIIIEFFNSYKMMNLQVSFSSKNKDFPKVFPLFRGN